MQSSFGKSTSNESGDLSLSKHMRISFKEDDYNKRIKKSNNKEEKIILENNDQRINRKKELVHADFIERLILGKITFLFLIP